MASNSHWGLGMYSLRIRGDYCTLFVKEESTEISDKITKKEFFEVEEDL